MQAQLPVSGQVTEANVDWLTATAREPTNRSWFEAHAPALIGEQERAGNDRRPWRWQDYNGWSCGGAGFGRRTDTDVVRLSSSAAGRHWREWAAHADNISRLDLAVTVRLAGQPGELGAIAYLAAQQSARRRGSELSSSLILNSDGGTTVYLGARASDRFGRFYNKGRESDLPEYADCWRYEVELKRKPALVAARWLARQRDEAEALRGSVWAYFHDRGVTPLFPRGGRFALPTPVAPRSDDERRLLWLHDQVRVVVGRLLATRGRATVMQALGLEMPGGLN